MGRFQLELIIFIFHRPSIKQQLFDRRTVENKGKLILKGGKKATPAWLLSEDITGVERSQ